jgi:Holliday junction resolvasome RuvABC endonuclease subunit
MGVLAIDLGSKTGWALRWAKTTVSGVVNLKGGRYEGGGMRFVRFRGHLTKLFADFDIKAVFYEEVRAHKGVDAAHIYGGLQAVLTAFCEDRGVPYEGVPVGTIKKFATGKGNADKAAVMAAMRELGFKPEDDNQADALALLMLKLECPKVMTLV